MVFIRAPIIESVGRGVEVLAEDAGHPVLVQQGPHARLHISPRTHLRHQPSTNTFFPSRVTLPTKRPATITRGDLEHG